jgi:hypothetical protein
MHRIRVVLGSEEFRRLIRGQEVETKDGAIRISLSDLGFEWMVEMIDEAAEEVSQRVSN